MSVGAAPRSRRTEVVMTGVRITLGALFLTVWASNMDKGLYGADQYAALIRSYAEEGDAPGIWKDVMGAIADGAAVFSKLQLVTELTLGVLLTLGLFTRIAAVVACVFLTSLWISELGVPNEWTWSLVFPAMVAFAVAWLKESGAYSLDERLLGRPPLDRLPAWLRG
ncbi:MAG: hypothetical protein H0V45_08400 [Actinobacteria bacterium]|nr:hypothetical protein [Actinomycetota bacterium]